MSQTGSSSNIPLNNKRIINAWAMFDWANSSYALVIAVAVFPQYYTNILPEEVNFMGWNVLSGSLFSYSLSFAYLLIALSMPLLSGVADYGGKKKFFMRIFTTVGSIACISLFGFYASDDGIVSHSSLLLGIFAFVLAIIGFAGGQIFYNSYLPLIASKDQVDRVSAKGFSYGYIGSVLLLIVNLAMIQFPDFFFLKDSSMAARISFIMVGLWWIGFAQITFRRLPDEQQSESDENLLAKGYKELKKAGKNILSQKQSKIFLFAFFFYSAGVQTVLSMAAVFASGPLKFNSSELIILILILQILAIAGAFVFSLVSKRFGNKVALISMLVIWMGICITAYIVTEKMSFYILASIVGMVMGGIQSLSRSTYSKLLPDDTQDTASYFSFFDVLEKASIVIGTLSFGLINQFTGNMRSSILALVVFFAIGLAILSFIQLRNTAAHGVKSA
ncbi:MAG: MFS transporter [Bacteroidota bacterium]